MSNKPYNLKRPVHLVVNEVIRRIEAQLQADGIMVSFASLPAVEDLIDQYNAVLTKAWDENNKQFHLLQELRAQRQSERTDDSEPA